jgi:ribosomal protein S18 acetylase RimI-like enzyme
MEIKTYNNASAYLKENESYLLREEALNSLPLGLTLENKKLQDDTTFYFDLRDANGIQLTGIKSDKRNVILYGNKNLLEKTIPLLFTYFEQSKIEVPGIIGQKDLILAAAKILKETQNYDNEVSFKHLVYVLTEIKHNPNIEGQMLKAEMKDLDKLSNWMHHFLQEALNENDKEIALKTVEDKIQKEELYLWQHIDAVSMSCAARPTHHGITINYVYTPQNKRKNGYATKLVAELSKLQLEKGYKFCTLFTDSSNPTSNSIYTKIGYELIGEFRSVTFI